MKELETGRIQIEKQIIEKAMKDLNFRNALKKDPHSTIEEEIGIKLPEGFSISVMEESANQFYIVLPPEQDKVNDELTMEELTEVAGGFGGLWSPVLVCESYQGPC